MSLIDYLRGRPLRPGVNGRVRWRDLSDEEEDELAVLAEEDAAILAAESPASVVDELEEIARWLAPSRRPKKRRR